MKSEQEIWKPIVGWEKYYDISSYGRVLAHGNFVDGRKYKDRIKAQRKTNVVIILSHCAVMENRKP